MHKFTYEYVTITLNEIGLEMLDVEYIDCKQYLTVQDKEGYLYYSKFDNLKFKKKASKFSIFNPYTIKNIQLWCKLNNKNFKLVSVKWEGNNKKLEWQCLKPECGEIFKSTWGEVSSLGRGCSFCAGHQVGLSNCLATKNPELAKEWHPTLNGNLTPWDVTYNAGKNYWWQCLVNPKHEWYVSIGNRHNHKSGCPYCDGQRATEENNLLLSNPELCKEWNYEKNDKRPEEYTPRSNQKVWWKCSKCNHEWEALINGRNEKGGNGSNCPECNESKGEKRISECLIKNNIIFNVQYTFNNLKGMGGGLLRFDFVVFESIENLILLLIEYDGIQHFEWQKNMMSKKQYKYLQIHDKRKNKYCIDNNIILIRIPYWDFDNIEFIINDILIKNNMDSKYIVNNMQNQ